MQNVPAHNVPNQSERSDRPESTSVSEDEYRSISLGFQKIGMAMAVVGAVLALWQYHDSARKQFQAPIWQK
jgi:hypothetical protein